MKNNHNSIHNPIFAPLRNPDYNPDGSIHGYSQFTPEIFVQEGLDHQKEHEKWQAKTKEQLLNFQQLNQEREYKIPPITHSVYLTSLNNPNSMKPLYVDNYGVTSSSLSKQDPNFVHNLWVNFDPEDPKYKDVIPEEIRKIPNLIIRNINEFKGHPLYKDTVDFLEKGKAASKFVEASDLIRVMAMESEGGIYHDLDWKLYNVNEMIKYMKNFDFINGREGEDWKSSIGNAFFASKANHPVVKKLSQIIERNLYTEAHSDLVPDYMKYPEREFDRIIFRSGPIAMTIAYHLSGNAEGNNDLICPSKILYNADYARAHQFGDTHNSADLENNWEGVKIKTIGGDQFSGNWGHTYLEKIKYSSAIINPLEGIIKENNLKKFEQLLPKITDQILLGKAFQEAVRLNRSEMVEQLLPKITDQSLLGKAFQEAVRLNLSEMVEQLLPKITNQEDLLEEALRQAVRLNHSEMFEQLLPKITNEYLLEKAFYETVFLNRSEMFAQLLPKFTYKRHIEEVLRYALSYGASEKLEQLLPKITDQKALGSALNFAIINNKREIFNQLLPKVTDQETLGMLLDAAVRGNISDLFDQLLPKVTDQSQLEKAFQEAVRENRLEMFKKLLLNINDKSYLNEALGQTRKIDNEEMSELIKKRIFAIDYPVLEVTASALRSVNDWVKEHDPIKLSIGAEAAKTSSRDPSQIMTVAGSSANSMLAVSSAKALPVGANTNGRSNQPSQASSATSAEKINQNLFTAITAFAYVMKAFGQNTDWLKPALGGKIVEVKMDIDPKNLFTNNNPEYDYIAKIKEMTKKASPLQQAALYEITEQVKAGETKDWSKEDWQNFMKDNHRFNAFIDAMEVVAKKTAVSSRPLTEKDIEDNKLKQKTYSKKSSKAARSSK